MQGALRAAVVAAAVVLVCAPVAEAQQPTPRDTADIRRQVEQRMGPGVTEADLVERLRQSGMTRSQARARLQQMGYDPGLVDRYYDAIERGAEPPRGRPTDETLRTFQQLGVDLRDVRTEGFIGIPSPSTPSPPTPSPQTPCATALPSSGAISSAASPRSSSRSPPARWTPTTDSGPGDQVVLVLTGDVEMAHHLEVTRDGLMFIPDVGQMAVAGLTMRQLEDRLYSRLSQVYSGVGRTDGATTQFSTTLGQLRANQVFIMGEVERPGAYQVSSVATVFNALYLARGPSNHGSFREIQVWRGDRMIRTVDLYRYLLYGDSRDDIRLEQGDRIFMPPAREQIGIKGAVRRPAIYELLPGEGMRELVTFAGGFEARALLRRVQIDRIARPGEARPGVDRMLVDVDVARVAEGEQVDLRDGDLVQVFAVAEERRNRLVLTGEVRRPGVYEWAPGMSLWDVIDRADGLSERAYTPRAHIFRLNEEDGTRQMLRTPLLADGAGRPAHDPPLADRDSIVVYSRAELRGDEVVHIDGFVREPGVYTLAEGMSVEDLILAAGGYLPGADQRSAEVARPTSYMERTQQTAETHVIALERAREGDAGFAADGASGNALDGRVGRIPDWWVSSDEFALLPDDRVFVRRAPGFEPARSVTLSGQVHTPGTYVLRDRQERLLDVLERAGGLTEEGHAPGLQLHRNGNLVATDMDRARRSPRSRFNLALEPGDSIHVPEFDPTVLVRGAVGFETRVLHVPGQPVEYYIEQAGGFDVDADRRRTAVTFQDGERMRAGRRFMDMQRPEPEPGSTVFVPRAPEQAGVNWDQVLSRTVSIMGAVATMLIAVDRIR
jgi:polysaccharide biosynthesis/export protein